MPGRGNCCSAQLVQHPGAHHGFQGTAVDLFQIDAATEIKQVLELTAIGPRRYDGIDGAFAQPLDGAQPIDDVALRVHGEAVTTGIHIRRQYLQAHGFAFINEGHHLVGVLHIRRDGGGHEFRRVVNLEPGGLVGDQCIGRGVGFVEAVTGEFFHQVEDLHGQVRVHALPCPSSKITRCLAISSGFFLPMARRNMSAPPSV